MHLKYNTANLSFAKNVLICVSIFVFSFPHAFVLRKKNMQSDLCKDYHGLSICASERGTPVAPCKCDITMHSHDDDDDDDYDYDDDDYGNRG